MPSPSPDALRILVVTPLGEAGNGGIDRVVNQLRGTDARRDGLALSFSVSRGPHVATSLLNVPLTASRIAWGALTGQLDVVHLNLSSHASAWRKAMLARACRLFGVPYVVHLHGSRFHKFWDGLAGWRLGAVNDLFRHAGAIVVLGDVWRQVVLSHVPDVASRIFVVPNATQARPAAQGSGPVPNVLFLGRLGERKGVPDLLAALARLDPEMPFTATIAGDGDVAAFEAEAARLGLSGRVRFPGWVGAQDVERLIAQADLLVLPSYDENLPMSVIEGMAAGLAVIATPVGATADVVVDGVTGLLVQPGDVDRLSMAIGRLLADPALRGQLGAAAQAFHRRELDARNYADRLLAPWRAAQSSRGGAEPAAVTHPAER